MPGRAPRSRRAPGPKPRSATLPAWLDLLPEPAAVLGAQGTLRGLSTSLAEWIGRPADAVLGEPLADFVHTDDRPLLEAALRGAGRPAGAGQVEVRLLGPAGPRAVEVLVADHRRRSALRGLLVTVRDQSARRAADRLVAESQLRLDFALWGSQVGFWEMDVTRDETRWFGSWCESLGIEPCAGRDHVATWDALIHPDDVAVAQRAFDAGLAGSREYYEAEYRIRTRDGWRWMRERGRAVARDPDGRALRMIGICVDIDAQKRTEERLRAVEAWHELALEAAQMPVWEWNVADGTLHVGRPRQATLVEPRFDRVHPDDVPRLLAAVARRRGGRNETIEVEYRTRTPQGEWKWVVDRGRLAQPGTSGEVVVRGVTIDIDDRKRLEAAVLDAVNREQQRLGRDLHDGLSQELTGASLLLSSTLSALARDEHPASAGVREAIAVIQGAIQTSRRIAQGLSSLTTLQGGLEDALGVLVEGLATTSGLPVRWSPRVGAPVRLDDVQAEHLYRIAQEAGTNALKHARATSLDLELVIDEGEVRVTVLDDGVGIPGARIGAGLGMRIMKYRADVLGARLRIERRLPKGTIVECVCPNGKSVAGAASTRAVPG
jgi:PAS domain S-box-containing protein